MKTLKTSLFTVLLLTCAFQSQAQEKGTVRVALSGFYADGVNDGGVNVSYEYFFLPRLSAAANWSYLFAGEGTFTESIADARYYFFKNPVQLYVTGGFSVYRRNYDDRPKSVRRSLGGGLGAVLPISGRFGANLQARYSIPLDSFVYQAGLTYNIRR